MKITIDVKAVKKEMIRTGFEAIEVRTENYCGWSNSIVIALENLYGVETEINKLFMKGK